MREVVDATLLLKQFPDFTDFDTLWRLLIGFKQQGSGSGGSGGGAHLMSGFSFVKLSQFLRHLHSQACTPVQVEAMKSRFHHVAT